MMNKKYNDRLDVNFWIKNLVGDSELFGITLWGSELSKEEKIQVQEMRDKWEKDWTSIDKEEWINVVHKAFYRIWDEWKYE